MKLSLILVFDTVEKTKKVCQKLDNDYPGLIYEDYTDDCTVEIRSDMTPEETINIINVMNKL